MIRIDEAWLAVDPLDMRAGFDTVLARVVAVFDAAHPHHAYLFTNRRANRMKVLVHDGIGIWLGSTTAEPGTVRLAAARYRYAVALSRRSSWPDSCSDCRGNALARTA